MEHEDWRVRLASVTALSLLGPERDRHRTVLTRLRRDGVDEVRLAAEAVLFDMQRHEKPNFLEPPSWLARKTKANKGKKRGALRKKGKVGSQKR
mmetsp:Transcript_29640/g.64503  ORF Transcript_29640/g.64503 Transcript_29640/m.64503 type:complete len:94 (-) Transcript_29640:86-367(-)